MLMRRFILSALLIVVLSVILLGQSSSQSLDIFKINTPNLELLERTKAVLISAKIELEQLLGEALTDSIQVFIAPNRQAFDSSTAGGIPDWGVGVAIPSRNFLSVLSPTEENFALPFEEVLRHELAHLALSRRVNGQRLPRFMDEGFAMMFAHQWGYGDDITIAKAQLTGDLFSLGDIDWVNMVNASQARIAYAQSYQAVKYIFDNFGQETFRKLLDGFRQGKPRNLVFREVIGTDFNGFDKLFAKYLAEHYHWFMIFTDPIFIWIGLALVIIIGFFLVRRRKQDYYKKWEEEEKLESTDYDYEESSPWD
jgi:LPXTG-motif cell wall-anchored protein